MGVERQRRRRRPRPPLTRTLALAGPAALLVTLAGVVFAVVDYELDCDGRFPRLLGPIGLLGAAVGAVTFLAGWRRAMTFSDAAAGQSLGTLTGFLAVLVGPACYLVTRSPGCGD